MRAHPPMAGVVVAALLTLGGLMSAQAQTAAKTAVTKPVPVAKPAWRELSSQQQRTLEPLASTWDELNEPHKRKWLAIVRDYEEMSAADKEILNSRMKEWAKLSNRERAQARLNFVDAKRLPADERKAKWEAYQALSDEEKGRLAASAPSAAPGAAATIRPVPAQKLVPLPAVGSDSQHTPRIQLAPPTVPPMASARPAVPTAPSAPVSAEAQVPAPAAPSTPEPSMASSPPVRLTDQPSSAP
ncbi:DUF3106 domain-containing protein [Variovorax saccharolyticus]|uniref:DUF3106 domain-containing protein n=1 Tax=Variovorax saccharolyticus TaxID=3053516 RepID=UPI002575CF23|nr:DUF3106 domain-containing protein [Variovorax sp. J31P216]MDM0023864.1 DUF3106 domain-containing protein [Variovorax sp. J31P216]